MSLERYGRRFGDAAIVPDSRIPHFANLSMEQQAREIAWSAGCPIPDLLIGERGAGTMIRRYSAVNLMFQTMIRRLDKSERSNCELVSKLHAGRKRLEPRGTLYESENVPEEHSRIIPGGLSSVEGFALPRMMLQYVMVQGPSGEKGIRLSKGLKAFEEAAYSAIPVDPAHLVVNFGERLIRLGANPEEMLVHMLGTGKLEEDNTVSTYKKMIRFMQRRAPLLSQAYSATKNPQIVKFS